MNQDVMVSFIGGGNMAEAILKGMLANGTAPGQLMVSEPLDERRRYLEETYAIPTTDDNRQAVSRAGVVVLAIKPQMASAVVSEFAREFDDSRLLVSILAGTSTATLEKLLDSRARVVRVMPNTPALIGEGATALCRGRFATQADLDRAEELFAAVGTTCRVEESQMDAVTAVSGSGPAYVFTVIEAMTEGGVREGLDRETAQQLAIQTLVGAAQLVAESGEDPAELRHKVCSPGGTTLAAIEVLNERDFTEGLVAAVQRAAQRSRELGA